MVPHILKKIKSLEELGYDASQRLEAMNRRRKTSYYHLIFNRAAMLYR